MKGQSSGWHQTGEEASAEGRPSQGGCHMGGRLPTVFGVLEKLNHTLHFEFNNLLSMFLFVTDVVL